MTHFYKIGSDNVTNLASSRVYHSLANARAWKCKRYAELMDIKAKYPEMKEQIEKSIDNLVNMPIFEITPYCGSWRVTNQYI